VPKDLVDQAGCWLRSCPKESPHAGSFVDIKSHNDKNTQAASCTI
jgi:hypothetical protein